METSGASQPSRVAEDQLQAEQQVHSDVVSQASDVERPVYTASTLGRLEDEAPLEVPRHRITSAYVQIALKKGSVTEKDVVRYLHKRDVEVNRARQAVWEYNGGRHNVFAARAVNVAKEIVPPLPTKRPPVARKPITPPREFSPEEIAASLTAQPEQPAVQVVRAIGAYSRTVVIPPEIVTDVHRTLIRVLEPETLSSAILPIKDTPYGDRSYPRIAPNSYYHRHNLQILGDDTIRVCDHAKETVLDDEQRLILNIMLSFGEYGFMKLALDAAGVSAPSKAMKAFRKKMNPDWHGIVRTQRTDGIETEVLEPRPMRARIIDKRTRQ